MTLIPVIVVSIVFILIAVRKIGKVKLKIWQIMLLGAVAVFFTGQISPVSAAQSINPDVMLFLFGMFIVGQALEQSGYLSHLSYRFFKRAKSIDSLTLFILFGMGFASAFLLNDTLAIIGTPVVLSLAKKHDASQKVLLLTLAFAVTIGSVTSPIGNPQNLLIAINGNISNPFLAFFKFLLIPTIVNLFLAFGLLKIFYKNSFHKKALIHDQESIKDPALSRLCKISLILIVAAIVAKIIVVSFGLFDFRLTYVALIGSGPILLLSQKRIEIVKKIDWHTLIFFASMFVLMESVWETGFFQGLITGSNLDVTSMPVIFGVSVILSQFISNVPLVTLYLPLLLKVGVGEKALIALAAGSTIAGNLFILGAASNVIIIQNSEKKSGTTITFLEFAKIGIPLTILNVLVYWLFLMFF